MDRTETLLIVLMLIGFCMVIIAAVGGVKEYFSESPEDVQHKEEPKEEQA